MNVFRYLLKLVHTADTDKTKAVLFCPCRRCEQALRDSEKRSIMKNRKSTTGFPTSYRYSVYITLKSPKGGSKAFKKIKFNFNRIKFATEFLCVKTSSGKVVV